MNFCTLFNTAYLSRGLVLYQSLRTYAPESHLYVFAFDQQVFDFFKKENLPGLTVIPLSEFEDPELLRVKPSRSAAEYCWTSTPSTILFCIRKFNLPACTYVDADLCFYANPEVLLSEMGTDSVQITEHRYSREYDQSKASGKYCVQFMTFRNDKTGMIILESWRNSCLLWCYARVEEGKFGDQKYLDYWQDQFGHVNELKHPGGGLAPWNIQQYSFSVEGGILTGKVNSTGLLFNPVFYHFHDLKFYKDNLVLLTSSLYEINGQVKSVFYKLYLKALLKTGREVRSKYPHLDPHGCRDVQGREPRSLLPLPLYYLYYLIRYADLKGKRLGIRKLHMHYQRITY
ncbi:MAG: glycosyl transferase [Bacteroidia bacterium]